MTKVQLDVILVLPNEIIELSNVRKKRKKKKGTTKCDKRTVTCDVKIAQCEDEIDKCEKKVNVRKKKKKREPLNVIKVRSHEMLVLPNVTMELSSVRKK